MKAIFFKELRNYFTTPLGYVFMAFMLVIFGIYFLFYGLIYGVADYGYVLNGVTMLVLFGLPLLTMRIFSEESRTKTDQLLLTAPIPTWKIVAGKYMAALALFTLALALTIPQPIVLAGMGGHVPGQKVIGGYIGFWLYGCSFLAIGMLISALTENQLVAAIGSIGIFMIIFLLDGIATLMPSTHLFQLGAVIVATLLIAVLIYTAIKNYYIAGLVALVLIAIEVLLFFLVPSLYDNMLVRVSEWISLVIRYSAFYTGVFDLSNVIFYLSFSALICFITVQIIEKKRWS